MKKPANERLIDELFSEPTGVLGTAERRVHLPIHHEPSGKGVARSIESEDGALHTTLRDALQHETQQAEHKRRMEAADPVAEAAARKEPK